MSQYGVIWMEEALQKLQQENTRLRQERDQLLEALEEKDIPDFKSGCCRKSYWEGFRKGVYAERMRNKSGCCCILSDDESEVLQWCALHASLRGSK